MFEASLGYTPRHPSQNKTWSNMPILLPFCYMHTSTLKLLPCVPQYYLRGKPGHNLASQSPFSQVSMCLSPSHEIMLAALASISLAGVGWLLMWLVQKKSSQELLNLTGYLLIQSYFDILAPAKSQRAPFPLLRTPLDVTWASFAQSVSIFGTLHLLGSAHTGFQHSQE